MSGHKGLVLDANILIRAVFGKRVREILEHFEDKADFYSPDICFSDARRYIVELCRKRKLETIVALSVFDHIGRLVLPVDRYLYVEQEQDARERIRNRDPQDWPVVAVALTLDLPIWTEDADFFGCGVATWITQTVQIYLRGEK